MSRVAAFIAGLGTGYMQQTERERDRARQEKRDAMEQERHDAFLKDRADADAKRKRLVEASKPASVNENAATLDMGAGPKVYDMPEAADVAASDMRQANRLGVPNVQAPQRTLAVNGIAFQDRGAAAARTEQYNSDEATDKRVAAAHLANGDYDKARSVQREATRFSREEILWAKKMEEEGAEKTAKAMLTGDGQAVFDTFNAQGKTKLKAPPTVETVDLNIPGFGVVKNHIYKGVLVNPDGTETPFTRDSYTANKVLLKFKDLLELQGKGQERADTAAYRDKQLDQQGKYQQGMLANSAAQVANSAAQLDLQRRKLDHDIKSDPFGKVPGAIKAQAQSLSKQIETINGAIANAQAKGDFNPESGGELIKRMTKLTLKYNALLQPYTGGAPAMADPAEFRSPAAAPKQASAGVPTQPPARPQGPPQAAQGIPPAQAVPVVPLPQAQQEFAAADAKLKTYGLRQRKADPQGFAAAQAAAAQAKAVLDAATAQAEAQAAEENRRRFAGAQGPALITPQP